MGPIEKEIMEQPPAQRLEFALEAIRTLTGGQDINSVVGLSRQMKVSKMQARMLLALDGAFPRALTKAQIMTAIHGLDWDQDERSVAVMASHIRAKHPGLIETHWGSGYSLTRKLEPFAKPALSRARADTSWTEEQDEDLRRMMENGSELSVIADEMDRSERAVSERWRFLRRNET